MAFFLFSFQVHEKSILLPLFPLTLIMSGRSEVDVESGTWEWGVLVNNVAVYRFVPMNRLASLLNFVWSMQYVAATKERRPRTSICNAHIYVELYDWL